ncbi:unnamed protein product [Diatraea saccharalis]|uniref:Uncharacterized protein n=1 Tax=Diatraea saccharalis TaxID=40085 RepID=A0A9N9QY43_9NEOP|nr:unnamed protein product [Diatraea saccharalis]
MGFGSSMSVKDKNFNFMKPLNIPKGADSWENIGIPPSTFEQIKVRHLSRLPPESGIAAPDATLPSHRSYPEPVLDSKIASHYEELKNSESFDISLHDYLIDLFAN